MAYVGTRRALLGGRRATPWWYVAGQTCVAAYQPIGAASLAASYVNLANPGTYDAAPGVAPTFDAATGWTFDDAEYLLTGIVPDRDWSMLCRFSDCSGVGTNKNMLIGSQKSGVNDRFYLWPANGPSRTYGNGIGANISGILTSGVMAIAGNQGYYNGSADGGTIDVGTRPSTYGLAIGGHNLDGTVSFLLTGKIQAVAIYSTTLSASDVAALTARMQAL